MSAPAKGAIEDFSLDPVTWEPMLMTIGNVRPKGICGSGLIIMTAVMFEVGLINNRGKFNRDLRTPRIRQPRTWCSTSSIPFGYRAPR